MTRRQRRRLLITALILVAVASMLSGLFISGYLQQSQRQASDNLFFKAREISPEPSQHVVIVAVDDKSLIELKQYGRFFYWPRTLHAEVIRKLSEARARTIAFDVLFDADGEGDEALVEAIDEAAGRATFVLLGTAGDPLTRYQNRADRWQGFAEVLEPLPKFKEVASGLGMANQDPDDDGTIRRAPLVFEVNGQPYPSLQLLAVARFLRRPQPWDGPIVNGRIPLAGREIPIDAKGNLTINYAGGPYESSHSAFTVVSFVDVLHGRVSPETFRGKLVLVGMTGTGYADDYWTPTSPVTANKP